MNQINNTPQVNPANFGQLNSADPQGAQRNNRVYELVHVSTSDKIKAFISSTPAKIIRHIKSINPKPLELMKIKNYNNKQMLQILTCPTLKSAKKELMTKFESQYAQENLQFLNLGKNVLTADDETDLLTIRDHVKTADILNILKASQEDFDDKETLEFPINISGVNRQRATELLKDLESDTDFLTNKTVKFNSDSRKVIADLFKEIIGHVKAITTNV